MYRLIHPPPKSEWLGPTVFFSLESNQEEGKLPTRHRLYGHLPPIAKTIQVRLTRHAGHCWRSRDELIRDVLLWTPTYGRAKAGRPARTYIQQLCEDTGCSPEDLPEAMNDWRSDERGSGISVLTARHDDDDFPLKSWSCVTSYLRRRSWIITFFRPYAKLRKA